MQIPRIILNCVAFLAFRSNSGLKVSGTCFFVVYPGPESEPGGTIFMVTARHVIEGIRKRSDGNVYVRLDLRDKEPVFHPIPVESWYMLNDSRVDVAVSPCALNFDMVNHKSVPLKMFLTTEKIEEDEIGPGDAVFFPGLFTDHFGKKSNIPIVRCGNIAAMPLEPVHTDECGYINAYLLEARSIGGLSGSPVFVFLGAMRVRKGKPCISANQQAFHLLGLIHGHYGTRDVIDATEGDGGLDRRSINKGIAIAVPADDIRATLDMPELVALREKAYREHIASRSED